VPANNGPQTVTKGAVPWKPGLSNLLPQFETLSGRVSHSPVSAAWSTAGLYFHMSIRGKKTLPRFLVARGGFSDGLRVWIDTRCSPGIHRGTRFCHCFHFFPGQPGGASGVTDRGGPFGILEDVPRAREFPASIDPKDIQVHSEFQPDGYSLWAHVPAKCLTGYSPLEFDRIRLYYDVVDSELGTQSMTLGPELRYAEDPSHWVQASLVGSIARSLR
jgi:hypothetical protein